MRVCVAMSGGVDSSVAAVLLQEQGHELSGVNLRMFHNEDLGESREKTCCSLADAEDDALVARRMGFRTVWNDRPEEGISLTIRLGVEELMDCQGILFMTADQPLLTAASISRLTAAFRERPQGIAAAACQGKRGNPCLFPQRLYPELLALQGDVGGSAVIRAHGELLHLVEVPPLELADCDTAQALQELEHGRKL